MDFRENSAELNGSGPDAAGDSSADALPEAQVLLLWLDDLQLMPGLLCLLYFSMDEGCVTIFGPAPLKCLPEKLVFQAPRCGRIFISMYAMVRLLAYQSMAFVCRP